MNNIITLNCSLIEFHLNNILNYADIRNKLKENPAKRKKPNKRANLLEIADLQYSDLNDALHGKKGTLKRGIGEEWIRLVQKTYRINSELPIQLFEFKNELHDFENTADGNLKIHFDEAKLKYEANTSLLYFRHKQISNLKSQLICSLNMNNMSSHDLNMFRNELSLMNLANSRKERNHIYQTIPLISMEFDHSSNFVTIDITFDIRIKPSIFSRIDHDIVTRVLMIINNSRSSHNIKDTHQENAVSPELFYRTISENAANIPPIDKAFELPELETSLLRFQRKTVNWCLEKENVRYCWSDNRCKRIPLIDTDLLNELKNYSGDNFNVEELNNKCLKVLYKLSFGWDLIKLNESIYFYNKYTANIMNHESLYRYLINYYNEQDKETYPQYLPAKGLLAEEMGLGKTVEITALILMNPRPLNEINEQIVINKNAYGSNKTITKSKTTLIIAPDSILKQWVKEIVNLAPSLAVTIYGGILKYPSPLKNNAYLISEYLRNFDVVFTTYSTISKELDYALYSANKKPTRNRPNRKKYDEYGQIMVEEPIEYEEESGSRNTLTEEELLREYQLKFQLSLPLKKPKIANEKSTENQENTDYERILLDEYELAFRHNRIPSIYKENDYQSPLMLCQFWRVVLDEVQMVSSKLSRAFQSSALIPRFHAWGVSGTPIKKNLSDLHSILNFLKFEPFCNNNLKCWDKLVLKDFDDGCNDFVKLWTSVALRHSKAMVHDDIKLPPQHRVLLTLPFNPVEQENYNLILEECLSAICLDVNGNPISEDWEPSSTVLSYMRLWLIRLRQICCNPQIGKLNLSSRKYRSKNYYLNGGVNSILQLKTLNDVLDDMLSTASEGIIDSERSIVQSYMDWAQLEEYIFHPKTALSYLKWGTMQSEIILKRLQKLLEINISNYKEYGNEHNIILNEIIDDDEIGTFEGSLKSGRNDDLEKYSDKIRNIRLRIRSWHILLHKFYFLTASCYFQCYNKEYKEKIEKQKIDDISSGYKELENIMNGDKCQQSIDLSMLMYKIEVKKPDSEISKLEESLDNEPNINVEKYQYLELQYYSLAESIRQTILKSSLANVLKVLNIRILSRGWYKEADFIDEGETLLPKTSRKFFKLLPLIDSSYLTELSYSMQVKVFLDKFHSIANRLNEQANLINQWTNDLINILSKPLLTSDKDPNGDEYEESINDQDHASSLLIVLTQILNDRNDLLIGNEGYEKITSIKKAQERQEQQLEIENVSDREFITNLLIAKNSLKARTKYSLLELVLELKDFELDMQPGSDDGDNKIISAQSEVFEILASRVRNIFENQKLANTLIIRELTVNCNSVFNARIDYFKQLQQISDSVKPPTYSFTQDNLTSDMIHLKYVQLSQNFNNYNQTLDKAVAKFRYLRTLVDFNEKPEDDESLMCIICRSTITIGSLTQCGHKYCNHCLSHWLMNSRSCPMCKTSISMSTVYNFTHYKPDLKLNQIQDNDLLDKVHSNLYSIYKPMSRSTIQEIQNILLKNSYSSKVDMIVKQVLYLKGKNPQVQIVIFSQWQELLYILGTAFQASEISYLASHGTLTPEVGAGRRGSKYDTVEKFKDKLNGITCFLLNARAQASGLTLINATHIFLCEPLVNTSLELQAISRIHRIGQTKETTVWMFAIENTVEENIVLMSTNKRLQYLKQDLLTKSNEENTDESSFKDADLSLAESMTLMNSSGIDHLVTKNSREGEEVDNSDLWNALFSAKNLTSNRSQAKDKKIDSLTI